jgi:lysyl-tRNA synthetase class II
MTSENPAIELKAQIKITSRYTGKSKFKFWSILQVGDIVEVSTKLKPIGRGSNGLYATTVQFNLVKSKVELDKLAEEFGKEKLSFSDSMTCAVNYIQKLGYETYN